MARPRTSNQRLNGFNPLSYLGDNPTTPTNFFMEPRVPTTSDYDGFLIGDQWLDTTSMGQTPPVAPTAENMYVLVSKLRGLATWVNYASGATALETLTGDSGGAVSGDASDNINILGTSGNITTTGSPGTNTLTLNTGAAVATSYTTDSGSAVPALGILTVAGGTGCATAGSGSTVTVNLDATVPLSFPTGSGTATPAANALTIAGSHGINTTGSGSTVTVAINNAITLGDLSAIAAGSSALTATTGDITITSGNFNFPYTNSGATVGAFKISGGSRFMTFNSANTFFGENAGLANLSGTHNHSFGGSTLATITSGIQNTAIGGSGLQSITSGSYNTALGYSSGTSYTSSESSNIIINNIGTLGESNVMRIGNGTGTGIMQLNKAFVSGIRGITTGVADAVAVLVDSANQLGTVSSSIRYKTNIEDMADATDNLLELRPVTFDYIEQESDRRQYGLIAEEVDEIMPDLVVYDAEGIPSSVRYHELPVMLLNEIKKLKKRIEYLESR